jgi:hypothetical protein
LDADTVAAARDAAAAAAVEGRSPAQRLASAKAEYARLAAAFARAAPNLERLAARAATVTAPYEARFAHLGRELQTLSKDLLDKRIELVVHRGLAEKDAVEATRRVAAAAAALGDAAAKERALQERFAGRMRGGR